MPGIDSTQSPEMEQPNNSTNYITTATNTNNNNTIWAAADSSDNQPSTTQPHITNGNDSQQPSLHSQQHQQQPAAHHSYPNLQMCANLQPSTTSNSHLNQLNPQQIYSSSNMDMQQQQQLQQPLIANHHSSSYSSYLNSYEHFYQQQQHQQQNPSQHQPSHQSQNPQMDYINSNSHSNSMYSASEYIQEAGVRYHPYLTTPISGIPPFISQNSNSNNAVDGGSQSAPVVSSSSSSVMSPRVSCTSPSSSSDSDSSIASMSAGNPSSPTGTPQCKKCGIMYTNETELQGNIANVHGASLYGSSCYASSPYVKGELQQQQTPSSQTQQQQQPSQQGVSNGGGPGEILDLDSQKMLYSPAPGAMPMMHQSLVNTDPLHGLHSMQQRAGMATWDQQSNEVLPPYLQQQQPTLESKNLSNQSPYYQSAKQSPYHESNSTNIIKSEYPIIKNEYPDANPEYMSYQSFDPTGAGSQQMMPPAVSSSLAEFPSTPAGGPQDSQQQSVGYQRFRHYNTTLHKNAVKSSGQDDPAGLPVSIHHHLAQDHSDKATRRANAAAAAAAQANVRQQKKQQQQLPPNPVQPLETPNSPQNYGGPQTAVGGMTPYTAISPPNSMYEQQQQYQQQHQYTSQVQSMTNISPQHASNMVGLTPTAKGGMESLQGEENLAEQEGDPNEVLHHMQRLPISQLQLHYQLDYHQEQGDVERHSTTPSSTHSKTSVHSGHSSSHQQYQEQQQQHQMLAQGIYTLTQFPSLPLAINMQQHSNMQQLQPQLITMELPAPVQQQQLLQTSDEQLVHVISTASPGPTTCIREYIIIENSPQEGDLEEDEDKKIQDILDQQDAQLRQPNVKPRQSTATANKRKRNPSTSSSIGANSEILPSGRIKCLPCNKEFTKICYLTQHNKSYHSGNYPYRCLKCGKRYQTQEVHDNHVLKHKTIDKDHKCNICPKQFHHKTDLRRHIEAIHTGNKPHCCDICEKSFCRKDHLRKHLETHNRPRKLSEKSVRAKNTTTTVGQINQSEDNSINTLNNELNLMPTITSQIILTPASHFNETISLSSATISTSLPQLQHLDNVAIDEGAMLEQEIDANEMDEEEPEYLAMQ